MSDTISLSDIQKSFGTFAEANGSSIDVAYADEELMIARCVLPLPFEVQPGDIQNGGVAVRASSQQVEVRPYLLRKVCTNGAIMLRSASGSSTTTAACTEEWLHESFALASTNEALSAAVTEVRTILSAPFDRAFLLATLMRASRKFGTESGREIIRRMMTDGFTGYSLMNAFTSVARDAQDPQTRWRLEATGGSIPALLMDGPVSRLGADALDLPSQILRRDYDLQLA